MWHTCTCPVPSKAPCPLHRSPDSWLSPAWAHLCEGSRIRIIDTLTCKSAGQTVPGALHPGNKVLQEHDLKEVNFLIPILCSSLQGDADGMHAIVFF